jgi:hypothetical protein
MTMFNPKGNCDRAPQEWAIEAMRESRDGSLQYLTIFGIIVSVAIVPWAGIPAGFFSFICFGAYAMQKADKTQQIQAAIQEFGCVANSLEGMNFKAFRSQVGDEEVAAQLLFAQKHGFPIKNDGLEFLENYQGVIVQAEASTPATHPIPQQTVTIPATNISTLGAGLSLTQTITGKSEMVPDIAREMADRLKPTLVVGVPGAGKDILVWNAVEMIKQSGKQVYVFAIDPKCDRSELPYFEGRVDKLFSLDFNNASPQECFEFLQDALKQYEEFDSKGAPKLLIFNELNLTTKVLKGAEGAMRFLETKLTFYSSSGRSRGWIIWAISQTAHEKGLGFGGETRPIFIKIVLITLANPDAAVDILRAQIIAKEQKLPPQELKKLCDRSSVGVAVYHGSLQKWFPHVKMRDFIAEAREKTNV